MNREIEDAKNFISESAKVLERRMDTIEYLMPYKDAKHAPGDLTISARMVRDHSGDFFDMVSKIYHILDILNAIDSKALADDRDLEIDVLDSYQVLLDMTTTFSEVADQLSDKIRAVYDHE